MTRLFGHELTAEKTGRFCRRATDIYIFAMLGVFPLFTWPEGYICLTEKKFAFFSVCTVLWAVLLLTASLSAARRGRTRLRAWEWCVLAFMLACTLSALLSEDASFLSLDTGRCDGLLTYLLYGCILLGVSRFGRRRGAYFYALGASCSVCCLVATVQLLGGDPLNLYPGGLTYYDPFVQETGLFLGTVGNIDLLSALCALVCPVMLSCCAHGTGKRRFLLLIPAALCLVVMLWVRVASGLLALGLTALLFFPSLSQTLRARARPAPDEAGLRRLRRRAWAATALVFFGGLALLRLLPETGGTLGEAQALLRGRIDPDFGSHRILIWRETFGQFLLRPAFGVGPDCLGGVLGLSFTRYSEALGQTLHTFVDNAHNEYLQILVSFGLCGFFPAMAACACALVRMVRTRRGSVFSACLLPGVVCYLIQAFFNIGLCIVTPVFLVLLALACAPEKDGIAAPPAALPPE